MVAPLLPAAAPASAPPADPEAAIAARKRQLADAQQAERERQATKKKKPTL
jgi:hypothetical protein